MTQNKDKYVRFSVEGYFRDLFPNGIKLESDNDNFLESYVNNYRVPKVIPGPQSITVRILDEFIIEEIDAPYVEPVWRVGDIATPIDHVDTCRWVYLDNSMSDRAKWRLIVVSPDATRKVWFRRDELPEKLRKMRIVE